MNQFVTEQLIYVLRLVAAALCGGLIGCERQSKKKTAGTRTHVIIAVASAMMMIISKYGFGDVLNEYVKLDPSRVGCGGGYGHWLYWFRHHYFPEQQRERNHYLGRNMGDCGRGYVHGERECIFWGLYPRLS